MPPIVLATGQPGRSGKGAYTGKNSDGANLTLDRSVAVPVGGSHILAIDSYWDIEEDWDYGYVLVQDGANPWVFLADMDGIFVNTNPNGTSLGWGLTGASASMQTLRFDLSAYAGRTITLRLRYVTDTTVTGDGWWIDNVRLDTTAIDAFENANAPGTFPTWANSSPGLAGRASVQFLRQLLRGGVASADQVRQVASDSLPHTVQRRRQQRLAGESNTLQHSLARWSTTATRGTAARTRSRPIRTTRRASAPSTSCWSST